MHTVQRLLLPELQVLDSQPLLLLDGRMASMAPELDEICTADGETDVELQAAGSWHSSPLLCLQLWTGA